MLDRASFLVACSVYRNNQNLLYNMQHMTDSIQNSVACTIGYEEYEAAEYALAACYLPRARASTQLRLNSTTPAASGRQATKWWADGEEPIYYVVSPKVHYALHLPSMWIAVTGDCTH